MRYERDYPPGAALAPVSFVEFDPETGAITGWGCIPRINFDNACDDGLPLRPIPPALSNDAIARSHFVDGDGLVRDKMPAPGTLSGLVLTTLPVPCTVVIDGERYEVTDGEADLSTFPSGTYRVDVEAVPYLSQTFTVTIP